MSDALTKLGEAARRARAAISPWQYIAPADVAGALPGGGIASAAQPYGEGLKKTAEATKAFREGRYGDAARWYGSGVLDTGTAALSALPEGGALAKLAMALGPAAKSGMRAWHTTSEPFDAFDWNRLGQSTAENVGGISNEDWAMDLARLGPWAHERQLTKEMGMPVALPVELGGEAKHFSSLDELQATIADMGGPERFREAMRANGIGHVSVDDAEFGGRSFIGLSPETFQIVK